MSTYVDTRRLHGALRWASGEKAGGVQGGGTWRMLVPFALAAIIVGAIMGALARPFPSRPLTPEDATLPLLVGAS